MTVASITRPAGYRKRRNTKPARPQQDNIVTAVFAAFGLPPAGYYNGIAGSPYTLLAGLQQHQPILQNGKLITSQIAEYPALLQTGDTAGIIAFSRVLDTKELLLVYNTSPSDAKEKFISISQPANTAVQHLTPVYGVDRNARVYVYQAALNGVAAYYIKIYLKPLHLIILKNF